MPKIFETFAQIYYTQIAIHRPEEHLFFETWTDTDVMRGHQMRDGHVVYGVEDHDGISTICVWLEAEQQDLNTPQRIDVRVDGLVLATLMEQFPIAIAPGNYAVGISVSPQTPEGLDIRLTLTPLRSI